MCPSFLICKMRGGQTAVPSSLTLRDESLTRGRVKKAVGEECVGVCTCQGARSSSALRPALLVAVLRVFVCVIAQDSRPQGHNLSQNPAPPPLGYIENTHSLSPTQKQNFKSNSVPIILATVGLMLVTVIAGVLIVKKYVCGGRFLVHRYSVLQQHAEANGVDGVDTLDTASHTNKSGYHDDSDEVRLFLLEG
uniref:Sortilin 1 n=1 Tax=Molossus molossus TaxID=27622 RepID=A0A7J8CU89_MOLMO|nr:sortilin 1 [Molossus molossus]